MPSVTIITAYPGPFRLFAIAGVLFSMNDHELLNADLAFYAIDPWTEINLALPHGPEWGIGAMP